MAMFVNFILRQSEEGTPRIQGNRIKLRNPQYSTTSSHPNCFHVNIKKTTIFPVSMVIGDQSKLASVMS